MSISVRIDTRKLDELRARGGKNAVRSALGRLATAMEAEAKQLMQEPKSGETYTLPGGTGTYTASAAGEAPAVVTGTLKNSIQAEAVGDGSKTWVVRVGADYASELEFGKPNMAARPFLRPAADKTRQMMARVIKEELDKAL